jgi:hypothetical protein
MKFAGNYAPKAHNGTMMKHDLHADAADRLAATGYRLPATSYQLPATGYWLLHCLLIGKLGPKTENNQMIFSYRGVIN